MTPVVKIAAPTDLKARSSKIEYTGAIMKAAEPTMSGISKRDCALTAAEVTSSSSSKLRRATLRM
eukprot:21397-Heterococcus_DN1.PRE.1